MWSLSLYLEALVMTTFAFFGSLILRSATTSAILCFAFYFLSRIFGFFLISINNPASTAKNNIISLVSEEVLKYIGIILPRLDMLCQSEWLIYGAEPQALVFITGALSYIMLLLVMSVIDFKRRQF